MNSGNIFGKQLKIRDYSGFSGSYDTSGFEGQFLEFVRQWNNGTEFFKFHTSGSTGKPKEIDFSRKAIIGSAMLTGRYLGLQPDDTALLCMPLEYVAGKMMLARAIVLDLFLVISKPVANPLKSISEITGIDFAAMTPMQVQECLSDPVTSMQLRNIKCLIIGGGPINPDLEEQLANFPNRVFETYGMTETLTHIAMKKINGSDRSDFFRVLPGIRIGTDSRNCLKIKAPHITDSEIITNDLIELRDDMHFRLLGRADNVINSGGIKIIPEQIEKKLKKHIGKNFIITGEADDRLGERVIMIIEGYTDSESEVISSDSEFKTLNEIFAANLSPYEKPRKVYSVEKLLFTSAGKPVRGNITGLKPINNV